MTAADVASINLHSDVQSVLQLMSPHDTATTGEHEVSLHSKLCGTIVMYFLLSNMLSKHAYSHTVTICFSTVINGWYNSLHMFSMSLGGSMRGWIVRS